MKKGLKAEQKEERGQDFMDLRGDREEIAKLGRMEG